MIKNENTLLEIALKVSKGVEEVELIECLINKKE